MSIQSRTTTRRLLFLLVALLVLGILAWGGQGLWAAPSSQGTAPPVAPPPPGPSPVIFPVGGGATISVTADLTVTVPPPDAPIGTQLVVTSATSLFPSSFSVTATVGGVSGSYAYEDHAYQLGLVGPDGTAITGHLSTPMSVTIHYSAADLAAAAGDPNNFVIMMYDPATGLWTPLPILSIDPVTGWVRASVADLPPGATIALFAKSP